MQVAANKWESTKYFKHIFKLFRVGSKMTPVGTTQVNNKRCKSVWKNVESYSSTVLEDEKLKSFLLERPWQVLRKTIFKELHIVHLAT